jgi:hypothetical protein
LEGVGLAGRFGAARPFARVDGHSPGPGVLRRCPAINQSAGIS